MDPRVKPCAHKAHTWITRHAKRTREESASFDRSVLDYIHRAAATALRHPRLGAKRKLPHFDDLVFLAASMSRYPLEGYREKCATDGARHALRQEADRAGHPDHHRRHELRRAVGQREGSARPRRHRDGHLDHHRRRRHDAAKSGVVEDAGLPVPALALRLQPGRPAPRRRHRGRGRPGRQARRRRHAAGPEGQPARGRMRTCPRASTSAAPAATPTGPARTTWRSRSRNCARSPTGRSRST
jgi:hypothetical protein